MLKILVPKNEGIYKIAADEFASFWKKELTTKVVFPIFISLRRGGAYFVVSKVESCIDFPFHKIEVI